MLRTRIAHPLLPCALSLALCACGDDEKSTKDAATALEDAGVADGAVSSTDAANDASASNMDCPEGLACVSPQGVFLCERPGPVPVLCEAATDCDFGQCYPLGGQGICLQTCIPPEGYAATTAVSGIVVEFAAGTGILGSGDAPKEQVLEGVEVCLASDAIKKAVPCVTTDADGKFEIFGLPPNRSVAASVGALVTFAKDGYVSVATGIGLGAGDQDLGSQVRLLTTEAASALAATLGASVPDETRGWIQFGALQVNSAGTKRAGAFVQGGLSLITVADATITSAPKAGSGPYYAEPGETYSAPISASDAGVDLDAGDAGAVDAGSEVASTSTAGGGYFVDVAAGTYTLKLKHPTLDCGTAGSTTTVIPGHITIGSGALCGAGTR